MHLPLRPFQKAALDSLKRPGHLICVAHTGAGKSLVYEQAAAEPGRRTLLVTPLIALARQQRDKLMNAGIPVALAAGQDREKAPPGKSGVWIVSPESLRNSSRKSELHAWRPNFLVVDECHCLWEWGTDFRPAFREIPALLIEHGITRSLWLTATLPAGAREELLSLLPAPVTLLGEFQLPAHLQFEARNVPWVDRMDYLMTWMHERIGSGVIFVGTRESTHRLERLLSAAGKRPLCYHAGLSSEERKNAERLVGNRVPDVVIATSAFGMGMDHPHLTWAVQLQAPNSLLSLAQAIGRAGRAPGKPANGLVLWDDDDFRLLEWTIRGAPRRRAELLETKHFLKSSGCRRQTLAKYFGAQASPAHCGSCDFCN